MPWEAKEAKGHTKSADTPKKQSAWAKIANAALKKYKNEGKAIKVANAAVAKMGSDEAVDAILEEFDRRSRKTTQRDPRGREMSTWEREEEEDDSEPLFVDLGTLGPAPQVFIDHLLLEFDDAEQYKPAIIGGGFLRAAPRIARSGIQVYRGSECGRMDMESVRVYRPEDQVFSRAAMKSMSHLPITLDHPGVMVDAVNWRD